MKPLLKWAGGKTWLKSNLYNKYISTKSTRVVELFSGGAALSFHLENKESVINDTNEHLMNFYKQLSKSRIFIPKDLKLDEVEYYSKRNRFNDLVEANTKKDSDLEELGFLFYYLNRTCFNGLCRFNKSGRFNSPYGKYKKVNFESNLFLYSNLIKNWVLSSVDFEKVEIKKGDFVYADPPYDDTFNQYTASSFSWQDQERLAKHLAKLDCSVVCSNSATPRILELYTDLGFKIEVVNRVSCISGDSKGRKNFEEILALRNV